MVDRGEERQRQRERDVCTPVSVCPSTCLPGRPARSRTVVFSSSGLGIFYKHKEQFKKQCKERNHIFIETLLSAERQSKGGQDSKMGKSNGRERSRQISRHLPVHSLLGHTEPGPSVATLGERAFAHTMECHHFSRC